MLTDIAEFILGSIGSL